MELAKKREELPQIMEVEKTSIGSMETNIDPHLKEDKSTAGVIKELIEVQVDANEPSHVVKIDKRLQEELVSN